MVPRKIPGIALEFLAELSLVDVDDSGDCITQAQENPNEESASNDVPTPNPNPNPNPPVGPFFIPNQ
ncbi:hypothetical protein BH18THE2_BH18THE2_19850 [soil metagenome]